MRRAAAFLIIGLCPALQADPPAGSDIGIAGLVPTSQAIPHGAGWAVPLRAAQPGWYSLELEGRVLEAAGAPVLAPEDAPLPSEAGIRPGAWMISPHGCTMNFIFARGSELFMGTAGHCVDELGQHVVLLVLTPGSDELVLVDIGTVVALRNNGIGDDFAVVSIRPALHEWVSPTTAVIGGPCGKYTGSGPELVSHYGHGLAIGTGGTPRVGAALTWGADSFGWSGPAISGDSGSPVVLTRSGEAAGDLTHLVVDALWLPSFVAGTRIETMLRILEGLETVNSPLCDGLPEENEPFIRGDANSDDRVDVSDPIKTLRMLFLEGLGSSCADAADADDSGLLDISDAVLVLNYLFLGGAAPSPPFPEPGEDPGPDQLPPCR